MLAVAWVQIAQPHEHGQIGGVEVRVPCGSAQYARAQTRQGHTKERKSTGGQAFRLELGVLTEHIANVIHDATHRPAIVAIDKLTQDPQVRERMTALTWEPSGAGAEQLAERIRRDRERWGPVVKALGLKVQ